MNAKLLIILALFLFPNVQIQAQSDENQDLAEEAFYQLKNACEQADYEQAGKLLVFRGNDADRKWKDYLRADKKEELNEIKLKCEEILKLLKTEKVSIVGYIEDKESEGLWCVLRIETENDGNKQEMVFAFLKLKIGMALGDIDN
jgi:hypothetical protein